MKTFKMISVGILHEGKIQDFPLIDGIIINQENSHRMWILEMFIDAKHKDFFEMKMSNTEELVEAKVVISYPDNDPAGFRVTIHAIKVIDDKISVLMKGRLKRKRTQYAEQLLEELIAEDLAGKDLLERFESDMKSRPRLKSDFSEEKK